MREGGQGSAGQSRSGGRYREQEQESEQGQVQEQKQEQCERKRRYPDVSPPVSCGWECKRGEVRWEERRREEGEESFKMSGSWSSSRGQDTPQAFMHTACRALQCTHACGGGQVGAEEYKSE